MNQKSKKKKMPRNRAAVVAIARNSSGPMRDRRNRRSKDARRVQEWFQ
jgi:hypothetical protein